MQILLQEDEYDPQDRTRFRKRFKELMGMTMEAFKEMAVRHEDIGPIVYYDTAEHRLTYEPFNYTLYKL